MALEVYVNGKLDIVGTAGDPSVPTDMTLLLGHWAGASGSEHHGGLLDDLRIYDRVLSETEINALANPPRMSARDPIPPDGALVEDTWVNLSWTAGDFAVSHDVYLGDNFDNVNNATNESETFRGDPTTTFYVAGFPGFAYPEGLVPGTTYYWRTDEVNDADPNSPWEGPSGASQFRQGRPMIRTRPMAPIPPSWMQCSVGRQASVQNCTLCTSATASMT